MTLEVENSTFKRRLRHWLAHRKTLSSATGLPEKEAVSRAANLLEVLRRGNPSGHPPLQIDAVEVLHAAVAVLNRRTAEREFGELTDDAFRLFQFIGGSEWPQEFLGERTELLAQSAFQAWRGAFWTGDARNEALWRKRYAMFESAAALAAENLLETTYNASVTVDLGDLPSEVLLSACLKLRGGVESIPDHVVRGASAVYRELKDRNSPVMPHEEQDYLLGELSLAAGGACRIQSRRVEASSWLDRAESHFRRSPNRDSSLARVMYERLALQVDERLFDRVCRASDDLVMRLEALGLEDEALKSRFLKATAWKETERYAEAQNEYQSLVDDARRVGNERLAAIALINLFQIHAFRGDSPAAFRIAHEVEPILRRIDNRVGIAKLHLGLGYLLRATNNIPGAIKACRRAEAEFRDLGLRADVVTAHLILADMFLGSGQNAHAEREVRAALPIIDQFQLVSEGFAALALLRQSLRRRQIDRQALRTLNRYFEKQPD